MIMVVEKAGEAEAEEDQRIALAHERTRAGREGEEEEEEAIEKPGKRKWCRAFVDSSMETRSEAGE